MNNLPPCLVILGPTASGKTSLSIKLAKKYGGEVISADSRQVYKGLDIGTGKVTPEETEGIPHHLIDIADPKTDTYSVTDFKEDTYKNLREITHRGNLPIICGGTGYYITTVVDNLEYPHANPRYEKEFENLPHSDILETIQREFSEKEIEKVDLDNPRRARRALALHRTHGFLPKIKKLPQECNFLQIGLALPKKELKENITKRLQARIHSGMIEEAQELHKNGMTLERMEKLGLEYRYLARHIDGSLTKEDMTAQLEQKIWQFAKRQMTWFKRDKRIHWFHPREHEEITEVIDEFLY